MWVLLDMVVRVASSYCVKDVVAVASEFKDYFSIGNNMADKLAEEGLLSSLT